MGRSRPSHGVSCGVGFSDIEARRWRTGTEVAALSRSSVFPGRMPKIIGVRPTEHFRLVITFSDGTEGERDFADLLAQSGSLVAPLRDPAYFRRAFTENGSGLAWPNGLDLDAVVLHDEMKAAGLLRNVAA